MGRLEKNFNKRRKRADLQKAVLATVAAAGIIGVALVAPNVLGLLKQAGLLPARRQTDSIRVARERLVRKGLLRWEGNKLRITDKGEERLRSLELKDYKLPKPRRWDGRWRVLIFDIPEKRKMLRNKIRLTLMSVGFVHLQHSVWIYPYPCEDFITLLKADFKVGKDMLYMIVDTLEYDTSLRSRFGLE